MQLVAAAGFQDSWLGSTGRLRHSACMAQIHVHASSQTFACESCGHLNLVPVCEVPLRASGKSNPSQHPSEHEVLEQVDLPPASDTHNKPQRTVSQAADDNDDLNALAAANAAKDGKLEQHLDELHLHQGQGHSTHQPIPRRSSHLHPSDSIPRRSSILSRSSSDARDLAEDQQLPQHSGSAQPHPPTSHLATPSKGSGSLQHSVPGSARSRDLGSLPGSRSNSGVLGGSEVGTAVTSLKGPTEVILEQIKRSTGSGHARNPSASPMSRHSKKIICACLSQQVHAVPLISLLKLCMITLQSLHWQAYS